MASGGHSVHAAMIDPIRLRSFALLLATLSLALVGASAATGASRRLDSNSVTFAASPPADPNAPAIANVVVSNDDNGKLTFVVNIPNRPSLTGDMEIVLFLDTDQNPNTGSADLEGADYVIDLFANSVDLAKWNGTTFDFSQSSPASLVFSYANGATITVNASDIVQGLTGFNFFVGAISGIGGTPSNPDFSNAHRDFAPAAGHGTYNYPIKITPLQISVASFTTSRARAGQPFTASMVVSATIPSALAQNATVTCTAKVGSKSLVAKGQGFAAGKALCSWQIPKGTKGKRITGNVSVSVQGLQASQHFSAKIG
jgi:hypothetical protein